VLVAGWCWKGLEMTLETLCCAVGQVYCSALHPLLLVMACRLPHRMVSLVCMEACITKLGVICYVLTMDDFACLLLQHRATRSSRG
jgi:hypothetical protein